MKVLVFVPMSPKTKPDDPLQVRIFGRSLQSIMRMKWSGPLSYHFEREDRPAGHHVRYDHILHRYQLARRLTLEGGYDALLTVESDMIVPPDALLRLVRADADVVYGLACGRGNKKWNVFSVLEERSARYFQDTDTAMARSAFEQGLILRSRGAGLGCTLIRRHVLEAVEFRRPEGGASNDWYFALDVEAAGYEQVTDFGTVCGHITTRPAPMIIWPDPKQPNWYGLELMPGVVIEPLQEGDTIIVAPGESVDIMKVEDPDGV